MRSELDHLGCVVELEVVDVQAHSFLECRNVLVPPFSLVGGLDFGLSWLLTLSLLSFFCGCWLFAGRCSCYFIKMLLGVPVDVKTVSTVWLEEHRLEVGLELSLGNRWQQCHIAILAIEDVTVSRKLLSPDAVVGLEQVFVLLRDVSHDGSNTCLELLVGHLACLFTHLVEVDIEALPDVFAILARGLDKEPG